MIFFFGFCQHNIAFIVVVDFNNFAIAFFKLYKNLGQKKLVKMNQYFRIYLISVLRRWWSLLYILLMLYIVKNNK